MAGIKVGIVAPASDVKTALSAIRQADEMGIPSAWMTSGGNVGDTLTLFAAAAAQTQRIVLGTSIMQMWSRHPVTAARQAQTIAALAPGRVRLGIGTGHRQPMTQTFGVSFREPLGHLREYLDITRSLLQQGSVDVDGKYYTAHARLPGPVDVPVLASALRLKAFEMCGARADGAISWVCPHDYLRDEALPAMRKGAKDARRPTPPLMVHAPVCVHENIGEVREAIRRQLGYFPSTPFYARMFEEAGFSNSAQTGWTDDMLDAVAVYGDEKAVKRRLEGIIGWGASEVLATLVIVGDGAASIQRTMKAIASIARD